MTTHRCLVVPVVGLKGGSAKTTTAVFVAHALHELGRSVLLVDSDPQQSAMDWQRLSLDPFPFRLMRLDTPHLDQQLPDVIRRRYDTVVIDSPPRDQHAGIVAAALRVATIALVPVAPTPIEYQGLGAVRAIVGDVPMAVLLTRVVANSVSSLVYRESVLRGRHVVAAHAGGSPGALRAGVRRPRAPGGRERVRRCGAGTTGEGQSNMSKREDVAAKAARMAMTGGASLSDPSIAADPREASRPATVKPKVVRVSLDLTPALYEDLTAWNRAAAGRLGRARVTNAETLRVLVRALLDDSVVSEDVIRRLSK